MPLRSSRLHPSGDATTILTPGEDELIILSKEEPEQATRDYKPWNPELLVFTWQNLIDDTK